jgi:hypothetical protein
MTMFNVRLVTSALAAASFVFAASQAQAATYDISLTGIATAGSYSSQDIGPTHYDQWVLSLSGLELIDPITVQQGDTINATITLDEAFTIPGSVSLTSFGFFLGGPGFPPGDTGFSGTTAFFLTGSPVIDGGGGTGTTGQLANTVVFFPPNNGPLTFDSVFSSFTIDELSAPVTLDYGLISYTLFSPNGAVPEPASWALMLVGFGGLGAVLRARRRLGAGVAAIART